MRKNFLPAYAYPSFRSRKHDDKTANEPRPYRKLPSKPFHRPRLYVQRKFRGSGRVPATEKLIGIEGKYYVMVGANGKEIRLLVNQNTELAGEFRPGDQIEVFTSPVEHAVAIKSAK